MKRYCNVPGCQSTEKTVNVTMHRVPSFSKFPELFLRILAVCSIVNNSRIKDPDIRICSKHYVSTDFNKNKNGKPKLIKGVLPSLNLPSCYLENGTKVTHKVNFLIDFEQKEKKYFLDIPDLNLRIDINTKATKDAPTTQSADRIRNTSNQILSTLKQKRKSQKSKVRNLRKNVTTARSSTNMIQKIKNFYKARHSNLLTVQRKCFISPKELKTRITEAVFKARKMFADKLSGIFTDAQVNRIISKKHTRYTSDEIASAIPLKYQRNTYEQLVKKKFPFPTVRTLQRWTQKIVFAPGILISVISLMKSIFQTASRLRRQAVICFDEVAIDPRYSYDTENDSVHAKKGNMTVFMVRGLFYSWKQIVAYDFDGSVTPNKFMDLVATLEKSGLEIRGVVCDMGGKNVSLWNKLNVKVSYCKKTRKTTITNCVKSPINNNNIYFFADVPHLLKNLRNNLLEHGFTLGDGETIGKDDLAYLISKDKGELRTTWKVTDRHLSVKHQEKQRVRLAAELLSNSVSLLWRKVFPNRKSVSNFIQTVNDSFDILNTRHTNGIKPSKMPYGKDLTTQNQILNDMKKEILTLRVGNSESLYPFQKGYLLSIKSLQDLYTEMSTSNLSVSFFLTHKFNQDILENTFSVLRGIGLFNQMPTATDAIRRLKLLMLSKTGTLSAGVAVKEDDDGPFLTGTMLSKLSNNVLREPEVTINLSDDAVVPQLPTNSHIQQNDASNSIDKLCEESASQVLAGYVAFKLHSKLKNLVAPEEEWKTLTHLSWYQHLRAKGYVIPSCNLRENVRILDAEFKRFHGSQLATGRGVLNGFTEALRGKYPGIEKDVIKTFVKFRTFIRINHLNKLDADVKLQKSKNLDERIRKQVDRCQQLTANSSVPVIDSVTSATQNLQSSNQAQTEDFSYLYDCTFSWSEELRRICKDVFGHSAVSKYQNIAMNIALSNLDCLLVMPTGSGKSLVYQACAVFTNGITVVVSPLISLIKDQIATLDKIGVLAKGWVMDESVVQDGFEDPVDGTILLYVSPERLTKSRSLKIYLDRLYQADKIDSFVVDEAHCLIEWGKEFRVDYKVLSTLKDKYPKVPVLAVTATAPLDVERSIVEGLNIPNAIIVRDPSFRTNLFYSIQLLSENEKTTNLLSLLSGKYKDLSGVIFCLTTRDCELVNKVLKSAGISSEAYHAKLEIGVRNAIQEKWVSGSCKIVVATTAFGMGVDKRDCRFVIHYSLPTSLIGYQQQTGRAGRDGERADCVLYLCLQDLFKALCLVGNNDGGRSSVYEMLKYCLYGGCRARFLREHFSHASDDSTNCEGCDNCVSNANLSTVNASGLIDDVYVVLDIAAQRKENVTALNVIDILFGKNRKPHFRDVVSFPTYRRSVIEILFLFLLSEGLICEKQEVLFHRNLCYLMKGVRYQSVSNCVFTFQQ